MGGGKEGAASPSKTRFLPISITSDCCIGSSKDLKTLVMSRLPVLRMEGRRV